MRLRPYQQEMADASLEALKKYSGVAALAATGAGKTCVLSYIAARFRRVLILQHLDELKQQNAETFGWVNPNLSYGYIDPDSNDFDKPYAFGMMQTVVNRLDSLQPVDLLIIDECHHLGAESYETIIERLRQLNPEMKIYGTTATIERGDKKSLDKYLETVAYQVQLDDLIRQGYLVPPYAYTIKIDGNSVIESDEESDEQIEKILNTNVTNEKVIQEWRDRASDRLTVAFCQTVAHAREVAEAFTEAGIPSTYVSGDMKPRERKRRLKAFEKGKYRVLTNAVLLTEGWNCPPASCLLLLRGSCSKGALIQMVGRVLRLCNPTDYPDIVKKDALILDFGVSLLRHRDLKAGDRLSLVNYDYEQEVDNVLQCPQCGAGIEPRQKQCKACLYVIERDADGKIIDKEESKRFTSFEMSELEIFRTARFHYEKSQDEKTIITHGWTAWALIHDMDGVYYTVAAKAKCRPKIICCTNSKIQAIAQADDFVSQYGEPDLSGKQKQWLSEIATQSQMACLPDKYQQFTLTKHQASCMMVLTASGRWDRIKEKINEHYESTGHQFAN